MRNVNSPEFPHYQWLLGIWCGKVVEQWPMPLHSTITSTKPPDTGHRTPSLILAMVTRLGDDYKHINHYQSSSQKQPMSIAPSRFCGKLLSGGRILQRGEKLTVSFIQLPGVLVISGCL